MRGYGTQWPQADVRKPACKEAIRPSCKPRHGTQRNHSRAEPRRQGCDPAPTPWSSILAESSGNPLMVGRKVGRCEGPPPACASKHVQFCKAMGAAPKRHRPQSVRRWRWEQGPVPVWGDNGTRCWAEHVCGPYRPHLPACRGADPLQGLHPPGPLIVYDGWHCPAQKAAPTRHACCVVGRCCGVPPTPPFAPMERTAKSWVQRLRCSAWN